MSAFKSVAILAAFGGAVAFSGPVLAAPLGGALGMAAQAHVQGGESATLLNQVQYRRGFGRGYAAPRYGYRRGWAPGAAVGLGVLGGAAIIGAATARPYYYGRQCWAEARPVYDRWGNYIGDRNIRVCN